MLSLIVPVYNVEKYLAECLDSIERQTSPNYEVVIVNDGSTDGCEAIIKRYCNRNKNFYYYYKENGGLMSAYLFGIEKSKGEYVGFVDSDDFIEPTFVEKMHNDKVSGVDIIVCDRVDFYEDGTVKESSGSSIVPFGFYNDSNNEIIYKNILPPFSGRHITNARWNKVFKRNIVLENLKYCESKSRIMEDRFFTPACMFTARTFLFIQDKLYHYRQRKSGSNHSMASPHLYEAIKLVMQTQKNMLIDKGIFEKYKSEYESACLNYLGLYVERNLLIKQHWRDRKQYCQIVVNDPEFQQLVKKHRKELKYKKGFALKVSYFLKSPGILSLFTRFSSLG